MSFRIDEEQYKNLDEEIENLIELNKEESLSDEKKDKMVNILKIIWKKDLIYNFSILFNVILSQTENKKTEFTTLINLICKYLRSPKNINIIKVCLQFYSNYQIELKEEIYFDLFKSIKSVKNMSEIANFLFYIDNNLIQIKLKEYSDDQNHDDIKDILEKLIKFKISIESFFTNTNNGVKDIDIINNFMDKLKNSEEIRNSFIIILRNYDLINDKIKTIK